MYAFKLYQDNKIDFSKSEYISDFEIFKINGNFDIKSYLEMRNVFYNSFRNSMELTKKSDKVFEKKKDNFYISIGSIVKFEKNELFVIDSNKNYLLCVPYKDDYRLTNFIKIRKGKDKIEFVKNLSSIEILQILKELSKNIHVMQDTVVQNYILKYQFEHKTHC